MTDFQFHRERKKERQEKVEEIHLWIKGLSNDKKSSWAFVYIDGKKDITFLSGQIKDSTDVNRIQLLAIIEFLEWASDRDKKKLVSLYTDSKYLLNLIKEWIDKWKKTQFKLPDGSDRPNGDLLRRLECLRENVNISMVYQFSQNEFSEKVYSLCCNELDQS